jgi:hypothetical protein
MTDLTHAFRIRNASLAETVQMAADFRTEMRKVVHQESTRLMALMATSYLDAAIIEGDVDMDRGPLSQAFNARMDFERNSLTAPIGSGDMDFRAKMVVTSHQGDVYGVFLAGQPHWKSRWLEKPGVEHFGLLGSQFDSAEKERRKVWEDILGPDLDGRLEMTGLEVKIHHGMAAYSHDKEEILAVCPSFEQRVHAQLKRMCESAHLAGNLFTDHQASARQQQIREALPEDLTVELLLEGPKALDINTPKP